MPYLSLTKKDYTEKLSRIISSYRSGTKVIGEARNFILTSLQLSDKYLKISERPDLEIYIKNWQCGPRKVKMIVVKQESGKEIPISKQKLVDSIYPPKPRSNRSSLEKQYSLKVRAMMRQLVDYQLREYRKSLRFPNECWETKRQILASTKIDIDHISKPFMQIADEWLDSMNLTYSEVEMIGPPNLKKFKQPELNYLWKEFHQENARLAPVLSSVNRSKGSRGYETLDHLLGSFKPSSPEEIDLDF